MYFIICLAVDSKKYCFTNFDVRQPQGGLYMCRFGWSSMVEFLDLLMDYFGLRTIPMQMKNTTHMFIGLRH